MELATVAAMTTVVSAAVRVLEAVPVWLRASERALKVLASCVVAFIMLWLAFNLGPLMAAWLMPVSVAVFVLLSELGALTELPSEEPEAFAAGGFRLSMRVSGIWFAVRSGVYVAMPAVAFNIVWPVAQPVSLAQSAAVTGTATVLTFLAEASVLALRQGGNTLASRALSLRAEKAVLAGESDPDEASGVDLDAQLAFRYQRARRDADVVLRRYLPANPRTAKRMVNHASLARAIAEQRGMFRDSAISQEHLAKWIALSEQWPALGSALTKAPHRMVELEKAASRAELQEVLDEIAPGTVASDEMRGLLKEDYPLGPVLDHLVRFEIPTA